MKSNEDRKFALENCRMLYRDLHKPCTKTCMCWGWEFHSGWDYAVREMSSKLEVLNLIFRPKYGVHVVMDQVKEKFGYLTCYFHTEIDTPLFYRILGLPFLALADFIYDKVNFGVKTETVEKGYYSDEVEKIESEKLDSVKKAFEHCSNVKIEERNGEWVTVTSVWHSPKTVIYPTKHVALYYFMGALFTVGRFLDFVKEPTPKQLIIQEAVDSFANEIVEKAVEKCHNTCEECGVGIGTDISPRVETKGWISYICEKCELKDKIRRSVSSIESELNSKGLTMQESDTKKITDAKELAETAEYHPFEEYESAYKTMAEFEKAIKGDVK